MATRLTTILVIVIVGATFIAGLIVGAQRDDANGPVDLIIVNGKVYPGGGANIFPHLGAGKYDGWWGHLAL